MDYSHLAGKLNKTGKSQRLLNPSRINFIYKPFNSFNPPLLRIRKLNGIVRTGLSAQR